MQSNVSRRSFFKGAGLAAPQVGILRRAVIVLDDNEEFLELINPEIILQEGEQEGAEGCLSVPGKWGMVTRPYRVKVRAQDRRGNWFEADREGVTARCFCHEIEHLDGHLYVEHIDRFLTDEEVEAELAKMAGQYGMDVESVKKYLDAAVIKEQVCRNKAVELVTSSAVAVKPEEVKAEPAGEEPKAEEPKPEKPKRTRKKKAEPKAEEAPAGDAE